jgi:hypothetical protein
MESKPDILTRLRAHRGLRAWLLALALATALSGLHAALHVGAALSQSAAAAAADVPADGDATPHGATADGDCAACRLASGLAFALLGFALLFIGAAGAELHTRLMLAAPGSDPVARWRQRRKHGPPAFPR